MKKILLLLCTVALMACSKDDDNIQYDNTKGYLTNLESVKFGMLGEWKYNCPLDIYINGIRQTVCENSYVWFYFRNNGFEYRTHSECTDEEIDLIYNTVGVSLDTNDRFCSGKYSVVEEDGKFFIVLYVLAGETNLLSPKREINKLDRNTLSIEMMIFSKQ